MRGWGNISFTLCILFNFPFRRLSLCSRFYNRCSWWNVVTQTSNQLYTFINNMTQLPVLKSNAFGDVRTHACCRIQHFVRHCNAVVNFTPGRYWITRHILFYYFTFHTTKVANLPALVNKFHFKFRNIPCSDTRCITIHTSVHWSNLIKPS